MRTDNETGLPIYLDAGEVLDALLDEKQGWRIWNGADWAPVDKGTRVDVILRNGQVGHYVKSECLGENWGSIGMAVADRWWHKKSPDDIIAYRLTRYDPGRKNLTEAHRRALRRIRKLCERNEANRSELLDTESIDILHILREEGVLDA